MDEHLLHAFARCTREDGADEVRMAILVAQVLDPGVRPRQVAADLDGLAAGRPADRTPWQYLQDLGFAGNRDDYAALDNSNLARVLETRRGIPITLGVILIRLARAAGLEAAGVNFPGHFVVAVEDGLVDPFVMAPVTPDALRARLPEGARGLDDEALFPRTSVTALGLRMLNNIKLSYARNSVWDRALEILDAQLRLAPKHPALHLERGDFWRQLGLEGPARDAFETALRLADDGSDGEMLREAARLRLSGLDGLDRTIH